MAMNTWTLRCDIAKTVRNGLYAHVYFNENHTVWGLDPSNEAPDRVGHRVLLVDLGNGTVAFQCFGSEVACPDAYASARVGDTPNCQVQFQSPNGTWITTPSGDEMFAVIPTGDGYFAIYSTTYKQYVAIGADPDRDAEGCFPLRACWGDIGNAARFTAIGKDHPAILDFLVLSKNAVGLSFENAGIAGLNLAGYKLSKCDFSHVADATNCLFDVADLTQANLSGMRLAGASLSATDLTEATLIGADFTAVKPWSATPILNKANLTNAVLPPSLTGASLRGAILSGVKLNGIDLSGADLTGADLRGATVAGGILKGATLTGANFSGLNLHGLILTGADLSGANLTECGMAGVDLTGTRLAGTNFTGVDLTSTTMPLPLTQSTDPHAPTIFARATLPHSVIGLNWSCLDLTETTIVGLPTDLTGLNAMQAILTHRTFDNFTLNGANFSKATLVNTVFSNALLRNKPLFAGANMTGAIFTKAKIDGANFVGAALGGVSRNEAAVFSYAYLGNCDFTQANLFGVSFAGATLMGANRFSDGANLLETDFSNSYLLSANFAHANLLGARFDGAFMVQCDLTDTTLAPAEDGAIPASLTGTCLQDAVFQGTDFSGADMTNAAISDQAGTITMQYYDADGRLTSPFALPYGAGSFPSPTSFDPHTICPNGLPYETNVAKGLSIAQMMTASNPATQWSPPNRL